MTYLQNENKMTKPIRIIITSIILFVLPQMTYAQSINDFFNDGYSTNPDNGSRTNFLSFITPNKIDTFFKELEQNFKTPKVDNNQYEYKIYDRDWSENEITVRLNVSIGIDLDKSQSYHVFIFAKDINENDLLAPSTKSKALITLYFSTLFEKCVKNGKPESFGLLPD